MKIDYRYAFIALVAGLFLILGNANSIYAQSTGLIYDPANSAGAAVMDPNGDGYTSLTNAGFGDNDRLNSEIPYVQIPVVGIEPTGDLRRGPTCGFTDFTDSTNYPVAVYKDASDNLMIRFRLAGTSKNSKGYSMLIDADSKFGFSGPDADPNAVQGNPGFEFEIVLETNFGVRLNVVDGSTNSISKVLLPIDQYHQKSIAANTISSCGTAYFYDFYMPFSVITAHTGYTSSTPLRYVFNTVMAPKGAMFGPISDIGGIDDNAYGSPSSAWEALMSKFTPVASNNLNAGIPERTPTPVVSGPISPNATVITGTANAAGILFLYRDRGGVITAIDTVNVTGAGPTYNWTANSLSGNVVQGDYIYATETAAGKGRSGNSNRVLVQNCSAVTGISVTEGCNSSRGIGWNVTNIPNGTPYTIYNASGVVRSSTVNTGQTNAVWYKCNGSYNSCKSGGNGGTCPLSDEAYWVTFTINGCETQPIGYINRNCVATNTPVITTPVNRNTSVVSGTSEIGATVNLYVNGFIKTTVVAFGTNYSFSGQSFVTGDEVTVRAQAIGKCLSAAASTPSNPPVITTSPRPGGTSLTGSSIEPAGSIIRVFNAAGTLLGSTTVSAGGAWTLNGMAAFATGQQFYATVQATGRSASVASNTVTVSATPSAVTPSITTLAPIEGTTSISGAIVSGTLGVGDRIILYEDGIAIDTTGLLAVGSSSWTISTLSATAASTKFLYSGGVLTARVLGMGTGVSGTNVSNSVTVLCKQPLSTPVVTGASQRVCQNNIDTIYVDPGEAGVVYTLLDSATDVIIGPSQLGTGAILIMPTYAFFTPGTQTIKVTAEKIGEQNCEVILANVASNEVDERPISDAGIDQLSVCGPNATLDALPANVGSATWTVISGPSNVTAPTSPTSGVTGLGFGPNLLVWTITNFSCVERDTVLLNRDCEATYTVNNYGSGYAYSIGDFLAEANDADISIVSASYTGLLPPGTAFVTSGPNAGNVVVTDPSALQTGKWTIQSTTTDANGGVSVNSVTMNVDNPMALPVELLSFTARYDGGVVLLNWSTANEQNNDRFEVERSATGRDFEKIITTTGAVDSDIILDYAEVDYRPLNGISYYRLKQIDLNGEYEYFQVVQVKVGGEVNIAQVGIYPNPASQEFVNLRLTGFIGEVASVRVFDVTGTVLRAESVGLSAGHADFKMFTDFKPGIYNIHISDGQSSITEKLIIL